MKIFMIGATGRVGNEFLRQSLNAGHTVTVLARDPSKVGVSDPKLAVFPGSFLDPAALDVAWATGPWDALVNVAGADPLKPSTLVTAAARILVPRVAAAKIRYLAITGTAQMPKTVWGQVFTAVMRLTPVVHASRDHDGAFKEILSSGVDYTLVGCPWIKDGPTVGTFRSSQVFPGGMKTIHPGDVALALFQELTNPSIRRGIRGIWY